MRVALLFEHPTWSASLLERLQQRSIDVTPINVGDYAAQLPEIDTSFDRWINRINAMPSAGRPASVVAAAAHLLTALELSGQSVINGSMSHRIGGSKAAQSALFHRVGLPTPASIAIYQPRDAVAAAETLGFPVLTKPNVGGSGSGIMRHDSANELEHAMAAGLVDLGIDGTGLVQRVINSADGLIYRVEMLGSDLFYGTTQAAQADGFNYCAVDGVATDQVALFDPSRKIVAAVGAALSASDAQVGGAEYMIDATTGEACFYDFNPYSNFVTGLNQQLGFDPIDRYIDFVTQ